MKIIAEVEAGIMNDEWCFFKPTFSGLYSIYSVAPNVLRQNGRAPKQSAPKRRRQTSRAKPAVPKRHVPASIWSLWQPDSNLHLYIFQVLWITLKDIYG